MLLSLPPVQTLGTEPPKVDPILGPTVSIRDRLALDGSAVKLADTITIGREPVAPMVIADTDVP